MRFLQNLQTTGVNWRPPLRHMSASYTVGRVLVGTNAYMLINRGCFQEYACGDWERVLEPNEALDLLANDPNRGTWRQHEIMSCVGWRHNVDQSLLQPFVEGGFCKLEQFADWDEQLARCQAEGWTPPTNPRMRYELAKALGREPDEHAKAMVEGGA